MAKEIPPSLAEAIDEEPDRFIDVLDRFYGIDTIVNADNPYQEFLIAFENAFGSQGGLNLWQYLQGKYKILNELYKQPEIQDNLPDEFSGPLKRKQTRQFWDRYEDKKERQQEIREANLKRPVKVTSYKRNGKKIESYSKTKGTKYTKREELFIKRRPNQDLHTLADNFNERFGKTVTTIALRDKRLRLLGKK